MFQIHIIFIAGNLSRQCQGMPRNRQLLVGGNDPHRYATGGGADTRAARIVRLAVQVDAEPGSLPAYRFAHRRGALADAGGKNNSIEAAERGGERAQLSPDAIDEQIDGELRPRVLAFEQLSHVARHTGYSEQTRLRI